MCQRDQVRLEPCCVSFFPGVREHHRISKWTVTKFCSNTLAVIGNREIRRQKREVPYQAIISNTWSSQHTSWVSYGREVSDLTGFLFPFTVATTHHNLTSKGTVITYGKEIEFNYVQWHDLRVPTNLHSHHSVECVQNLSWCRCHLESNLNSGLK